jgi:hypothetical protein
MLNTSFEVEAGREAVVKWKLTNQVGIGRRGELEILNP